MVIKYHIKKMVTYLSGLLVKDKYQFLYDTEFIDIVGECLKLNPKFFMNSLYKDLRRIAKKNLEKREEGLWKN